MIGLTIESEGIVLSCELLTRTWWTNCSLRVTSLKTKVISLCLWYKGCTSELKRMMWQCTWQIRLLHGFLPISSKHASDSYMQNLWILIKKKLQEKGVVCKVYLWHINDTLCFSAQCVSYRIHDVLGWGLNEIWISATAPIRKENFLARTSQLEHIKPWANSSLHWRPRSLEAFSTVLGIS